ncbi:hypothetical protein HYZ78_02705 [Candidatus Microgenomates bacterium]|nr:hypothetical protein [Candidatus Microgenomates bacterium]
MPNSTPISVHTLVKIVKNRKKRVGRGAGSGKGSHTVGRGQKGQKSREKVSVSFFGTKMKKSLLKKLPMQRGKGKLKPKAKAYYTAKSSKIKVKSSN